MLWTKNGLNEGDVLYKYHEARFNSNRNFLGVVLGATGSAKSYSALRICEIDYKRRFNEPFPIENVTFSIGETMKRIKEIKDSGRKGEIILPDDIGAAGYGSLEFQNKTSRMFSYILQSFRSLNIGLLMTLPVFTMLNNQGRQLIHYQLITQGIDYENKISKAKPLFHQLNQSSGKSYWKYPKISVNKIVKTIKRLNYSIPSRELREKYEQKKAKFLTDLTSTFLEELRIIEKEKIDKMSRINLSTRALEVFQLFNSGKKVKEIAEIMGITTTGVYDHLKSIRNKGYQAKNRYFTKPTQENELSKESNESLT